MVHTARINLSQASRSPSRFQNTSKAPISSLKKYGCLGQKEGYHTRMKSHRNLGSNSKILNPSSQGNSQSRIKMNNSRSERANSKSKKELKNSHGRTSHKRKRSKRREIMDYLEDCIKKDGEEVVTEKTYQERLVILQEFLWYLEDKNIINPNVLSNAEEVKKLVSGLMKIDLTKICNNNNLEENNSKERDFSEKYNDKKYKKRNSSGKRMKYSMIVQSNKENVPQNESAIQPVEWSTAGYHTRRLSQHEHENDGSAQNSHYQNSVHNRNYSTGSILHLKEVDWNQIINQKVGNKRNTRTERNENSYNRPSSVIYQNNYMIDHDKKNKIQNDIPKPVISVSNNIKSTSMIPAPVFNMKEEQKMESAMFWSSDSSSTMTMVYNKGTVSSSGSADRNSRRLSNNHTKSKDSTSKQKFKSIQEVDESASDFEATEKTIQVSALNNYNLDK